MDSHATDRRENRMHHARVDLVAKTQPDCAGKFDDHAPAPVAPATGTVANVYPDKSWLRHADLRLASVAKSWLAGKPGRQGRYDEEEIEEDDDDQKVIRYSPDSN